MQKNTDTDLYSHIMRGVYRAQQQRRTRYMFAFGFLSSVSLVGSVVLARELIRALVTSGFWSFITLIFSDVRVLTSYTTDVLSFLGESFPALIGVAFFVTLFVFLWSIRSISAVPRIVRVS